MGRNLKCDLERAFKRSGLVAIQLANGSYGFVDRRLVNIQEIGRRGGAAYLESKQEGRE